MIGTVADLESACQDEADPPASLPEVSVPSPVSITITITIRASDSDFGRTTTIIMT